jgi:hypothetical protein
MDERSQPSRRASLMRLLAAALSGAIGAFGIPAGAHAAPSAAPAIAPPPAPALTPDATTE